jgi:glutamyl-Q tRNA(Asp) synthetase
MARATGGHFLLRMEDTDLDRCRPEYEAGSSADLTLARPGLGRPDPPRQSDHFASYNARLEVAGEGLLYPCSCTRADIRAALSAPQEGVAFPSIPEPAAAARCQTAGPATPCA